MTKLSGLFPESFRWTKLVADVVVLTIVVSLIFVADRVSLRGRVAYLLFIVLPVVSAAWAHWLSLYPDAQAPLRWLAPRAYLASRHPAAWVSVLVLGLLAGVLYLVGAIVASIVVSVPFALLLGFGLGCLAFLKGPSVKREEGAQPRQADAGREEGHADHSLNLFASPFPGLILAGVIAGAGLSLWLYLVFEGVPSVQMAVALNASLGLSLSGWYFWKFREARSQA